MRVAIWGAGRIGAALAYRLVTCEFVSSLEWINRTYKNISARIVDLEHGLAFAPCCRHVGGTIPEYAREALADVDLVILTQGEPVPKGGTRDQLLAKNRHVLQSAVDALAEFKGIVLVVSNPVDALARHVQEASGVSADRVFGLGTVVETARLRSAIAGHMLPDVPPRSVWCFAIGTHDEQTRVVPGPCGVGLPALPERVWKSLREEVIRAPQRVKVDDLSTLHPVVEGAIAVARAIGNNSGEILTVSVKDDQTPYYFSIPVSVGRTGVLNRHTLGIASEDLAACRQAAAVLQDTKR